MVSKYLIQLLKTYFLIIAVNLILGSGPVPEHYHQYYKMPKSQLNIFMAYYFDLIFSFNTVFVCTMNMFQFSTVYDWYFMSTKCENTIIIYQKHNYLIDSP